MALRSFRSRLFLALLAASLLPVLLIFWIGWLQVQQTSPLALAGQGQLDSLTVSWRVMDHAIDSVPLTPGASTAMEDFRTQLDAFVRQARESAYRYSHTFLPQTLTLFLAGIIGGGGLMAFLLGRRLTRQLSDPLEELVHWTDLIRRRESLPVAGGLRSGPREFLVLQRALREMQRDLDAAAETRIESERLRAFGEVARRVAHEMKNPLTPIRLAVAHLSRQVNPDQREMLEIIAAESARLEAMAREFAELGRLPEGVTAPVDLRELLEELLRSAVPESMDRRFGAAAEPVLIDGYYDPLRRAFSNLLRNAVEATNGTGTVAVTIQSESDQIVIRISDNGPGIPADRRELIFQPYFTDKRDGTGLGLAIVRQTVEQHQGRITVVDTPGGGASFEIRFSLPGTSRNPADRESADG